MSGNTAYRADISGVTLAKPCVITTAAVHGYQTNQVVTLSDLGNEMPTARGATQLNDRRFRILVVDTTSFQLWDVVTGEEIDSTNYEAWVSGGNVNLQTRVLALNNPQQRPYSETSPYDSNPYLYEA